MNTPQAVKALIDDMDEMFGANGKFWDALETDRMKLETPEQIAELASDTLTELFGMRVRGL